jgi:hypothetical protein
MGNVRDKKIGYPIKSDASFCIHGRNGRAHERFAFVVD